MSVSNAKQKNKRHKNPNEYLFVFDNCETLTAGILFLYRLKINFKSVLYKTEKDYRLIIYSPYFKPCFLTLGEYCIRANKSIYETAYTKEHGKLLINRNAVRTFGKYFFKEI